jgi:hypothetical protein
MTNIKQLLIAAVIFAAIIIGYIVYSNNKIDQSFNKGFIAGQKSIVVTTKIDTVRDTIRISGKKPKKSTYEPDSATIAFVDGLIMRADELEATMKDRLQPRDFFVGDSIGNYATIHYMPIEDTYDGQIVLQTLNTEVTKVKEGQPCPLVVQPEKWYTHPSIFIAGGATGIVIVASGGTVLMGLGAVVAVGGAMTLF